jgi:CRISPR-associated protein Cmr4
MTQFFSINCRTHLHVGSGDSNYGVIDKLVQRDPANQSPCIFASSLKGAFREYFKEVKGVTLTEDIFGKDERSKIIFHQAFIISIPARSNQYPYFSLTAPMAIDELKDQIELLGKPNDINLINDLAAFKTQMQQGKAIVFNKATTNLKIEDFDGDALVNNTTYTIPDWITALFGERIVLVNDADYIEMCSDYRLPVIARNNLENGQSKNLWYEQIIPRESRFFFAVSTLPNEACKEFFQEFISNKTIQIGANATIGYGVCTISPF